MTATSPIPTMSATSRVAAVRALVIPAAGPAITAPGKRALAATAGGQSADIDGGSLVAFTAGVSADHTSAALNSTLLASMNSDKHFNRNDKTQLMAWYANYTKVLQLCGWDAQAFGFQNYSASGSTVSINDAILEIVAAAATGPEVKVVQAALDALKKLGTDNPWYKVWDSRTRSTNGGNFQIVPASDANGARNTLVMRVSAFAFTTTESTTEFLWVKYSSSDVQLHYGTQTLTLDEDIWDQVSDEVITKIGGNDKTQIGGLDV